MNIVVQTISTFFLYAVGAVFAQNAVFSRSLGVSRLVKMVGEASSDNLLFCGLLCLVQVISAPLAWMANRWILTPLSFRAAVRPLVLVLCSAAALGIVIVVCSALRRPSTSRVAQLLPMATFNCAVIGCLPVTTIQNFTLVQTLSFAVGSGAGYTLAVLAVTEGQRKLQARAVPAVFRGLPVTLLYIGILALAIYGFTGHTAAF